MINELGIGARRGNVGALRNWSGFQARGWTEGGHVGTLINDRLLYLWKCMRLDVIHQVLVLIHDINYMHKRVPEVLNRFQDKNIILNRKTNIGLWSSKSGSCYKSTML